MARYQILSPDGFTIEGGVESYPSMTEANKAFKQWKDRYKAQGYYSSNRGRIDLKDLKYFCTIKIIN